MLMKSYGVIFDMDGVLIDSCPAHFKAWTRLARAHGQDFTYEQFVSVCGQVNDVIIPRLWGAALEDASDVARWAQEKEGYYREILRLEFPTMKGADALIAALHKADFRLAVGSAGPKENVYAALDGLANSRLFSAVVHAGDLRHGKPDPEVFLLAAQRMSLPTNRCCVIEDAPLGLQAARAAGMAAIGLTGTSPREQLAPLADRVVDSLEELTPADIAELIDNVSLGK